MSLDWLRTRPDSVKATMREFPPVCRVHANIPLACPAPGRIGRVVAYAEDGGVRVMDEAAWFADDPNTITGLCRPEWLDVVQYAGNKTPEWIDRVLAGEDLPVENPGLSGIISGPCPGAGG